MFVVSKGLDSLPSSILCCEPVQNGALSTPRKGFYISFLTVNHNTMHEAVKDRSSGVQWTCAEN